MSNRSGSERTLPQLTKKQREVLALVADNRTSKEIAGLLGISESAVNQRIEIVRARLGGLPRGELARLYRLNFSTDSEPDVPIWQKIHLPTGTDTGMGAVAESIHAGNTDRSPPFGDAVLDGSQLSAAFSQSNPEWLSRENRPMAAARGLMIAAIVLAALASAILITMLVGPGLDAASG